MPSCSRCGFFFISTQSYWGHLHTCVKKHIDSEYLDTLLAENEIQEIQVAQLDNVEEIIEFNEQQDIENDMDEDVDVEVVMFQVDITYLQFQEVLLKKIQEYELKRRMSAPMNKVRMSNGEFKTGNRAVYTELVKFTASRMHLSGNDNTELIQVIKRISSILGCEIPLPSRYHIQLNHNLNMYCTDLNLYFSYLNLHNTYLNMLVIYLNMYCADLNMILQI